MIRILCEELKDGAGNGYSPNAGRNPTLKNQPGQDNFNLSVFVFASNTEPAPYVSTWNIKQFLLDDAGVVAHAEKDVPVSIPVGASVALHPMVVGTIMMKDVDTNDKTYFYRLCIKAGEETINDSETPLHFNITDTTFAGPTVPFDGGGEVVIIDTNFVAEKELVEKEARLDTLVGTISTAQEEIKVLQPRIEKLKGLLTAFMMLLSVSLFAAAPLPVVKVNTAPLYDAGQVSVETFIGTSTADFKAFDGLYGVGVSYSYHPHWTIGGRVLHHGWEVGHGTVIQDVQGRITGRLSLKEHASLSPYIFAGAGYRLGSAGLARGRENFHLDSGGGLEHRFTAHLGVFAEAGWSANISGRNAYTAASGIRWTF